MSKILLTLSLIFILAGCSKIKKEPVIQSPNKLALVIGNPVDYGFTELLMFPVGANYNPKISEGDKLEEVAPQQVKGTVSNSEDKNNLSFKLNTNNYYDRIASMEYINSSENDFDIRNILFYDKKTGESRPLVNDTIHILSFSIHKEFKRSLIFFRVVKRDINTDKKYNAEDAVMLYVSDLDGNNFTQITPENEQFFDYFYYPETNTILIKTALDIDKSKSFNNLDETTFREMKILTPAMGREIFSKDLKENLKKQMSILQ